MNWLPRIEWDFSQVEDLALSDATAWEYARTSDKLRTAIVDVLHSITKGKSVQAHIDQGLFRDAKTSKQNTQLRRKLRRQIIAACGNFTLLKLLIRSPHRFPEPWTKIQTRSKRNSKFRRAFLFPMSFVSTGLQENNMDMAWFRNVYRDGSSFHLKIDWEGHTLKDILMDVEREIRDEAKKHRELLRGKPAQAQTEQLKWLAAYRLQKSGATYEQSQAMLSKHSAASIIPIYSEKSGWSKAIGKARELLKEIETPHPWSSWFLREDC